MTTREFLNKIDAYNARVYQAEQELRRLAAEHEILRAQASDYMRLSQFDAEIATAGVPRFTYPEGYHPPADAAKPQEPAPIIRHGDQAAE